MISSLPRIVFQFIFYQNYGIGTLKLPGLEQRLFFITFPLTLRCGTSSLRRFRWSRRRRLFRGLEKLWLLLPLQPIRGKENLASRAAPSKSLRDSPSPPLEDTTKISFSYGFRRNKFLTHSPTPSLLHPPIIYSTSSIEGSDPFVLFCTIPQDASDCPHRNEFRSECVYMPSGLSGIRRDRPQA